MATEQKNVKSAWGRVPSPRELNEAQKKYAEQHKKVERDKQGIPVPQPPRSFKHDVFKLEDYEHIDIFACKVGPFARTIKFKAAVEYLVQPCKTQMEKVRSIVRWIAAQDIANWRFGDNIDPETPEFFLNRAKSNSGAYTDLLQQMMDAAEIPCASVSGKCKASTYDVGDEKTTGPAYWSCVCIDDDWRIIHMGWMCQSVSGVQAGSWKLIEKQGPKVSDEEEKAAKETHYGMCDEDEFLVNPHECIYVAFPNDPKWQLLAKPLTEEEFNKAAYCRSEFFDHELDAVSHTECVLLSQMGEIVIELKVPESKRKKFFYKFYQARESSKGDASSLQNAKNFVFHEQLNGHWRAEVRFPVEGCYKLEISCMNAGEMSFELVCAYVINCPLALIDCKPHPENNRNEWGPGYDVEQLGMTPNSHKGGRVIAIEGSAEIIFDNPSGVKFLHQLESPDVPKDKLENYVIHRTEKGKVVFHVKLPEKGEYNLKLYARQEGETGSFQSVCNYLVDAKRCSLFTTPFPKVNDIGLSNEALEIGLNPKNHDQSHLKVAKDCTLEFTTAVNTEFEWNLLLQTDDGQEELDNLCFLEHLSPTEPIFKFRFPKPGIYHFRLWARPIIAGSNRTLRQVANYILEVQEADFKASPFPKATKRFHERKYYLLQPLEGQLLPDQEYSFVIEGPEDAEKVQLAGVVAADLTKGDDGKWRGRITSNKEGGELFLQSADGKLVDFQVLTPSEVDEQKQKADEEKTAHENLLKERKEEERKAEEEKIKMKKEMEKRQAAIDRGESIEEIKRKAEEEAAERRKIEEEADRKKKEQDKIEREKKEEEEEKRRRKEAEEQERKQKEHEEAESKKKEDEEEAKKKKEEDEEHRKKEEAERKVREEEEAERKKKEEEEADRLRKEQEEADKKSREEDKKRKKKEDAERKKIDKKEAKEKEKQMEADKKRKKEEVQRRRQEIIDLREALLEAMEGRNTDILRKAIQNIKEKRYQSHMEELMAKAEKRLEILEKVQKLGLKVLKLEPKTLHELKLYAKPAPTIHEVLKAAFLLLGENERKMKKWKKVQKHISPKDLMSRIESYDPDSLHPRIWARTRDLSKTFSSDSVAGTSAAAAAIFEWVKGIVQLQEPEFGPRDPEPATGREQRRILKQGARGHRKSEEYADDFDDDDDEDEDVDEDDDADK